MSRKIALLVLLGLLISSSTALAGPLAGHANSIPAFTGSTPFASGTLSGYVDYAVFLPGDYPGYAGYTPTPGELVYAYQITVTGTAPVSVLTVGIDPGNPVDNIGSFIDGYGTEAPIAALFTNFPIDGAEWDFAGIPQGSASIGLAYSSPNIPMDYVGTTIDHGEFAFVVPLPSPSPVAIPEPSSVVLAALAGIGLVMVRRRRS